MSKREVISQHNKITQARYDMSALEINLFFMLVSKLDKNKKSSKIYQITLRDLQESIGKTVNIRDLKQATSQLLSRRFTFTEDDGSYLQVGLIASAEYIKGKAVLELELSEKMNPYLFDLKNNFTTYQLYTALRLKSKYAKRLYQILSQFKSTGIYKTTLKQLKEQLKLYDPKTEQEKYVEFSMFRRKVLEVAQKELEDRDISFTYKAIKVGRKYEKLHFFITHSPQKAFKKPKKDADLLITKPKPTMLLHKEEILKNGSQSLYERLQSEFHLNDKQIRKVFKHFSLKEINQLMYEVLLDASDKKVSNRQTYMMKKFEKMKPQMAVLAKKN